MILYSMIWLVTMLLIFFSLNCERKIFLKLFGFSYSTLSTIKVYGGITMKKDIKKWSKLSIGLLVSVVGFIICRVIATSTTFTEFIFNQDSSILQYMLIMAFYLCVVATFSGIIACLIIIGVELCCKIHNKKVENDNCKLRQKTERQLPKKTEFNVSVSNQDNERIHKLLYENIKCTALFDGKTVNIKFSLNEDVNLETDNLIWFENNFNY